MTHQLKIDLSQLQALCAKLREAAPSLEQPGSWPRQQLAWCAEHDVFRWFSASTWGGLDWPKTRIYQAYIEMAAACLTTTFVLTQRQGACRRIENSDNQQIKDQLLPQLSAGTVMATLGISHLTTSRQHLTQPVLLASPTAHGFRLDGHSPWVTGGPFADWFVVGATLDSGKQILAAVDAQTPGVTAHPGNELMALTASQTGQVTFDGAEIPSKWLLSGPVDHVMAQGSDTAAGGLQTSALALGTALAAINYLAEQSEQRRELTPIESAFREQLRRLTEKLLARSDGDVNVSTAELRARANDLAIRSTQSALLAAKGAGFVAGHPTGRWCREALFFLVWSCPQSVLNANLCQLAGVNHE